MGLNPLFIWSKFRDTFSPQLLGPHRVGFEIFLRNVTSVGNVRHLMLIKVANVKAEILSAFYNDTIQDSGCLYS